MRWTRYGKDRLYVMQPDGIQVGWVDLSTGERHLVADALRRDFEAALSAYGDVPAQLVPACTDDEPRVDLRGAGSPGAAAGPPPGPAATEPDGDAWVDLAANRPGAGARARARRDLARREGSRVGGWVARALDLRTDERGWRTGAAGEEGVGAALDRLERHGWHVLHAVPLGTRGTLIDHLLVGPGGVLTVATRCDAGRRVRVEGVTVTVNGQRVPCVGAARHEAARAAALLGAALGRPVAVAPVLVLLTGTAEPQVEVVRPPDDVVVLDRTEVPGVLRRRTEALGPDEVEEIYAVARRSTTWTC
ncbi:MAG: nuclease-related domain-containing protein [Candidatus Nanopelagicales bacterium]